MRIDAIGPMGGREFPMTVMNGMGQPAPYGVPKDEKFQIHTKFDKGTIPFEEFYKDYSPLTFVFQHDDRRTYERTFTREEIKAALSYAIFYERKM